MNKLRVPIIPAEEGQSLNLGKGARLDVLSVSPRGSVLLLHWNDVRILIPAGADFDFFAKAIEPVNVLLLPESGYGPLNPTEWIEKLQPDLILLSVEAGNRAGLPRQDLLEFLQPYELLRTDVHGWIEIVADGRNVWVETENRGFDD